MDSSAVVDTFKKGFCSPVLITVILMLVAVVSAYRRGWSASMGEVEAAEGKDGKARLVGGSLLTIAFLWALCYFGFEGASWFFLVAPMVLAAVEVLAVSKAL